jgi:hypothetical protein
MKQIILCIGCGVQSGCRISGIEYLCENCKRMPMCLLSEGIDPSTESFITCNKCVEKGGDYD